MFITVHIGIQVLKLHVADGDIIEYPVSTGIKGVGQQFGSGQTPLGRHVVRAKIGAGLPENTVFVARRPTGEIYSPKLVAEYHDRRDWILSRILWLSGMEYGLNRLGSVDTMRRYIYIHGIPDTFVMGEPLSHGCIRMHNRNIIDLFQRVPMGVLVDILMD
ncbi:MAG: L,D-transpeptidase [Candidatus Endonucleobacter sp. (ex Gigantidas childressi)]|nr:L,D-transpeptidase [Candidatus Endonucleobacter sp. (ex Gigantidas childressi)]